MNCSVKRVQHLKPTVTRPRYSDAMARDNVLKKINFG